MCISGIQKYHIPIMLSWVFCIIFLLVSCTPPPPVAIGPPEKTVCVETYYAGGKGETYIKQEPEWLWIKWRHTCDSSYNDSDLVPRVELHRMNQIGIYCREVEE